MQDPLTQRAMINNFLDWAQQQPNVWIVTNQQLLAWMRNPVPVSQLNSIPEFQCKVPQISATICNGMVRAVPPGPPNSRLSCKASSDVYVAIRSIPTRSVCYRIAPSPISPGRHATDAQTRRRLQKTLYRGKLHRHPVVPSGSGCRQTAPRRSLSKRIAIHASEREPVNREQRSTCLPYPLLYLIISKPNRQSVSLFRCELLIRRPDKARRTQWCQREWKSLRTPALFAPGRLPGEEKENKDTRRCADSHLFAHVSS